MEKIIIKELAVPEYDKIKKILGLQQRFHYDLNGPFAADFLKVGVEEFKDYMFERPKCITYVALDGGEIVGFSAANMEGDEGFIKDLFVCEKYRGEQLGKKLFDYVLKWLESNGCKKVNVHVSIGNEKVIHFYEKFGFKNTGYTLIRKEK